MKLLLVAGMLLLGAFCYSQGIYLKVLYTTDMSTHNTYTYLHFYTDTTYLYWTYLFLKLFFFNIAQECKRKVDLVFAMDSSGSMGRTEYIQQKRFVQHLTRKFNISPRGTHAGVIVYSDKASIKIGLNEKNTWIEHARAVSRIPHEKGNTRIDLALRKAKEIFHPSNGGRKGIPKILMVLTDGQQTAGEEGEEGEIPQLDREVSSLKRMNVKTYAIGIGR